MHKGRGQGTLLFALTIGVTLVAVGYMATGITFASKLKVGGWPSLEILRTHSGIGMSLIVFLFLDGIGMFLPLISFITDCHARMRISGVYIVFLGFLTTLILITMILGGVATLLFLRRNPSCHGVLIMNAVVVICVISTIMMVMITALTLYQKKRRDEIIESEIRQTNE
ncbi:hypothetical protein SNEBB_005202 [Seison nebaliae]|nr:hypothetical protein SNEBB_005202 [Seison nebaliae]